MEIRFWLRAFPYRCCSVVNPEETIEGYQRIGINIELGYLYMLSIDSIRKGGGGGGCGGGCCGGGGCCCGEVVSLDGDNM